MSRLAPAFLACALLVAWVSQGAAREFPEVRAAELKEMMETEDVVVVFPLSAIEYNDRHIPGSIHVPMHRLRSGLPKDKNWKVVFYCLGRR